MVWFAYDCAFFVRSLTRVCVNLLSASNWWTYRQTRQVSSCARLASVLITCCCSVQLLQVTEDAMVQDVMGFLHNLIKCWPSGPINLAHGHSQAIWANIWSFSVWTGLGDFFGQGRHGCAVCTVQKYIPAFSPWFWKQLALNHSYWSAVTENADYNDVGSSKVMQNVVICNIYCYWRVWVWYCLN